MARNAPAHNNWRCAWACEVPRPQPCVHPHPPLGSGLPNLVHRRRQSAVPNARTADPGAGGTPSRRPGSGRINQSRSPRRAAQHSTAQHMVGSAPAAPTGLPGLACQAKHSAHNMGARKGGGTDAANSIQPRHLWLTLCGNFLEISPMMLAPVLLERNRHLCTRVCAYGDAASARHGCGRGCTRTSAGAGARLRWYELNGA